MTCRDKIEKILKDKFSPLFLEVLDQSDQHRGHAGARQTGGGHFVVTIQSPELSKLSRIESHRLIWQSLKAAEQEIHALSIQIKE
jgi:BolA protein